MKNLYLLDLTIATAYAIRRFLGRHRYGSYAAEVYELNCVVEDAIVSLKKKRWGPYYRPTFRHRPAVDLGIPTGIDEDDLPNGDS